MGEDRNLTGGADGRLGFEGVARRVTGESWFPASLVSS